MRSSIARGVLALLSVAAITGCQSGSTWSPTWWNPFHTTSSYHLFDFLGSGGAGPAFVACQHRRPAAATAAARPPTRTRPIAAPRQPLTAPRRIPMEAAAMVPLPLARIPLRSLPAAPGSAYPGSYNSATPEFLFGHIGPAARRRIRMAVTAAPRHQPQPARLAGIRP